jgi:hypothetical protein
MNNRWVAIAVIALLLNGGCAGLGGIRILPPTFQLASEQATELRLLAPTLQRPIGGASLRIYTRVENPNPVGITLSRLVGTLRLEGLDAADADFPLGMPLAAGASTVVPLDISINFLNLPGLADIVGRAVTVGDVGYSLRGTATVDAGVLGQPSFGPMMLVEGRVKPFR